MMDKNMNMQELNESSYREALKSGTTTVGIKVKDGVVIATESQASAGYTVASKKAQKLFKINDFTAATIAGGVADAQYVINQITALSNLAEVEKEEVPDPKYIANITRNILFSGRSYYQTLMIIGGYSQSEQTGKLYGIDLLGTLYEEENYLSYGSGSTFVLGVLESDWKEDLTKEEGIDLAKKAITSAKKRDMASGYDIQISYVSNEGYEEIQ
jgi:proteasome beta subunit